MRTVIAGVGSSSGWCVVWVASSRDPPHDLECVPEISKLLVSLVFDVRAGFFVGVRWNNTCTAKYMYSLQSL